MFEHPEDSSIELRDQHDSMEGLALAIVAAAYGSIMLTLGWLAHGWLA